MELDDVLQRNESHSSTWHILDCRSADDRILDLVERHGCRRAVIRETSTGTLLWYHDLLRCHPHALHFRCLWRGGFSGGHVRCEMGHDPDGSVRLAVVALAFIRFAAFRNACIFRPWHHAVDLWKWIRSSASPKISGPPRRTRIGDGEQAGSYDGGKLHTMNPGFPHRRGWPMNPQDTPVHEP